jgi:hypothetical protein
MDIFVRLKQMSEEEIDGPLDKVESNNLTDNDPFVHLLYPQ